MSNVVFDQMRGAILIAAQNGILYNGISLGRVKTEMVTESFNAYIAMKLAQGIVFEEHHKHAMLNQFLGIPLIFNRDVGISVGWFEELADKKPSELPEGSKPADSTPTN